MQNDQKSTNSPFSKLTTIPNYNTPAVQAAGQVHDGDEFILITRSRQSQEFNVWSSGDEQQTEQLYRQAQHATTAQKEATA